MPKYRVHYNEIFRYNYDIEAPDEDAATDAARLLVGNELQPEDSHGEFGDINLLDDDAEVEFRAPVEL